MSSQTFFTDFFSARKTRHPYRFKRLCQTVPKLFCAHCRFEFYNGILVGKILVLLSDFDEIAIISSNGICLFNSPFWLFDVWNSTRFSQEKLYTVKIGNKELWNLPNTCFSPKLEHNERYNASAEKLLLWFSAHIYNMEGKSSTQNAELNVFYVFAN